MTNGPADIDVRPLGEDDVPALIRCLRLCYGHSYASPAFYEEERIRAMLRERRLHSRIGVTAEGRVVGHLGALFGSLG